MAKGEGKGQSDILECCAVCGTATVCCCIVLVVLALFGLGIAKIVIGAIYLNDCPLERMVPIYLIVSGCAPILLGGIGKRAQSDDVSNDISGATICGLIGFLFNLAWLIAGSVWVFPTWGTTHKSTYIPCSTSGTAVPGCQLTCNDTVLTFAFAMLIIDWTFMIMWFTLIGYMIYRMACAKE